MAALAVAVAVWRLEIATAGLVVSTTEVRSVPVTVFQPDDAAPAPTVVIAHGFAGSQQLMQPFAVTLARNGYVAVTFDFPGHGRNPTPLRGGLTDDDASSRTLLGALDDVVAYARGLPGSDGQVALLGHSMAADIVVRHAAAHPEIAATVAVSVFSRAVTADAPRNLLVVVGGLEPGVLIDEGHRILRLSAGEAAVERVTYGDFGAGTARRLALADGVEHIGVLYGGESLIEAQAWLNGVFGRAGSGFIDRRGPWLGLLFLGLVALAWPLARRLPSVTARPLGSGLGWRRLLPVALLPPVLTPLLLWPLPTGFLPLLLGDYLTVHFAVYGLLTAAGLWWLGAPRPEIPWPRLLPAAAAAAAFSIVALGLPIDRYVTSFLPTAQRLWLMPVVLAGLVPWFLADEWLTRGPGAPRGAYALTKLLFVASLALAIALSPERLFFLAIIAPVILVFFVVYGLFSRWACRATGHPFAAALGNAAALAWAIAVTFPIVAR